MTWKCVPHKMFLWILLLDTFQMKNPSDATLASLSILKYSKIQNGRQMAENSAKINIIMYVKLKAHFSYCPYCLLLVHQTMPVQKRHHYLFEKIKNQDGVQDGWHKQENSIPELHILNVLCLKCSFYVLIYKNTII